MYLNVTVYKYNDIRWEYVLDLYDLWDLWDTCITYPMTDPAGAGRKMLTFYWGILMGSMAHH